MFFLTLVMFMYVQMNVMWSQLSRHITYDVRASHLSVTPQGLYYDNKLIYHIGVFFTTSPQSRLQIGSRFSSCILPLVVDWTWVVVPLVDCYWEQLTITWAVNPLVNCSDEESTSFIDWHMYLRNMVGKSGEDLMIDCIQKKNFFS